MGRSRGSRNTDFDEKRDALADSLLAHLLELGHVQTSFRALADACEVSPPTLRHYFGDRAGAIGAAFEAASRGAKQHFVFTIAEDLGDLRTTLVAILRHMLVGWRAGVGALNAIGIAGALGEDELGPEYLNKLLEPTLQAFEARLARHVARGEIEVPDLRLASLQLVSPIFLALLHQHQFGGTTCRPLDIEALIEPHVDGFLRMFPPAS